MATVKVEARGQDDWYPVIDVDEWWAERVDDDGDVIRDDDGEPILACPECGGRVELYG